VRVLLVYYWVVFIIINMTTPGQYFNLITSQATQSSWVGARNPNLLTPLILLLLTLPYLPFVQ